MYWGPGQSLPSSSHLFTDTGLSENEFESDSFEQTEAIESGSVSCSWEDVKSLVHTAINALSNEITKKIDTTENSIKILDDKVNSYQQADAPNDSDSPSNTKRR